MQLLCIHHVRVSLALDGFSKSMDPPGTDLSLYENAGITWFPLYSLDFLPALACWSLVPFSTSPTNMS